MRLASVITVVLMSAFALSPLRSSAVRWLASEEEKPERLIAACSTPKRDRPAPSTSDLAAALQEGGSTPSVVYLVPEHAAQRPRETESDSANASLAPTLTLSARARVHAGEALHFVATWRARGAPVTVAHPFHSGGKTQVEYTLFVRDEATNQTYRLVDETPMMCGTRNALGDRDFIPLDAHSGVDVTPRTDTGADLTETQLLRPGRYAVWLAYSFCELGGREGRSFFITHDHRPPPATFSGELASNAVVIDVY